MIGPTVAFKSDAFPKYPNEDEETINPSRWGKRLAEFVRDNLPSYGVETEGVLCEDWGWLVGVVNPAYSLWIGCGPIDDDSQYQQPKESEGAMEAPQLSGIGMVEFSMFVVAEPGLLKRLFRRIDVAPGIARVVAAMESMLQESAEFHDVDWTGNYGRTSD